MFIIDSSPKKNWMQVLVKDQEHHYIHSLYQDFGMDFIQHTIYHFFNGDLSTKLINTNTNYNKIQKY